MLFCNRISKGEGMRKAKIIATMGPACEDERVLAEMVAAGMNVARFNMSHGDQASHKKQIDSVKRIRERLGIALPIMIDTKGPEIRIKQFENGEVVLKEKQRFTLTACDEVGSSERVSVTYKNLPNIVGRGTRILLADGLIELRVISTTETDVNCEVVFGGVLGNNKSINIPGVELDLPYLSVQDKADILFAVNERAEYLAISFVRNKEDVGQIRAYLHRLGDKEMKIISKIENQEGVDNIDEIIAASDGIMVARGDLGVEVPFEKIPAIQKQIISKCKAAGKLSITATQMLESMITHSRPTRAEISDVANAILDGTGSVMLSGETSVGAFPARVIETMSSIIVECEAGQVGALDFSKFEKLSGNLNASVAFGACALAKTSAAKAIIAVTRSGSTAIEVSRFRPDVPILGCTPNERVFQSLGAVWGVYPIRQPEIDTIDRLIEHAKEMAVATKLIKKGDLVVQTAGKETRISGSNMLILDFA